MAYFRLRAWHCYCALRGAADAPKSGVNAMHMEQGGKPTLPPLAPLFDPRAFRRPEARKAHSWISRARAAALRRHGLLLGATRQGKISFALSRLRRDSLPRPLRARRSRSSPRVLDFALGSLR